MKIIAHRANINGPNKSLENKPEQILYAISQGYDCEIDLWYINNILYLGHDEPQYQIGINFLIEYADKLWCHCKHMESFESLLQYNQLNCFYHQSDDYILTSKKNIWVYPGKTVPKHGIVVMPEWHPDIKYNKNTISGMCTDYPSSVESFLII